MIWPKEGKERGLVCYGYWTGQQTYLFALEIEVGGWGGRGVVLQTGDELKQVAVAHESLHSR